MNIGMILDNTFPPDPRVENEAISLIKNGFNVYLFCLMDRNESKEDIINGIFVKRYKSNQITYKLSALAYTLPFYHYILKPKIDHFIEANKIDYLHIHDIQIARTVFWLNRKYKLPIILDLHENRPEIMRHYAHVNTFFGRLLIYPFLWKKYETKYLKKASKVIVVTKEAKDYYLKRIDIKETKIVVVPNTIRKEFYSNCILNDNIIKTYHSYFTILYLGDTGLRRGLKTVLDGLKKIVSNYKNIKLVIVGKSKDDSILKQHTKQLKLEDYVDFMGWQDFNLFPSYIKASTICISPIIKNIHHDTTYANKIFQYMAFAKPLLVSNCYAQENIIKESHSGLVFESENSEDFANKIVTLYNDKALRERLGTNGKKFIENKFHWDMTSKDLVNFYKELELSK